MFGFDPIAPPGEFWVSTSENMNTASSGWHEGLEFLLPQATLVCGADVALLVLKDSANFAEAVPASPGFDPLPSHAATKVTAIGFGESAPGARDFGVRRIRQANPVVCLPGDPSLACAGEGQSFVAREFVAATGACEGDSGSGAYDQSAFDDGRAVVLGILSRDASDPACSNGVYERIDPWASFIAGGGKVAARLGGYAPPAWTNVPDATDPGAAGSPFPPRALGAQCSTNDDCDSNLCRSTDGGFSFQCTQTCTKGAANSCPKDFACVAGAAEQVCAYDPAPAPPKVSGGGCAVAPSVDSAAPLTLVILAIRRRRRASHRSR
jgi:hypothetical protein